MSLELILIYSIEILLCYMMDWFMIGYVHENNHKPIHRILKLLFR